MHLHCHSPLDEILEIAEVAYAIAVGSADGEDRDDYACHLPVLGVELRLSISLNPHLFGHELRGTEFAVHAVFPSQYVAVFIYDHIFVFCCVVQQFGVDVHSPFLQIYHLHSLGAFPFAQLRSAAADGEELTLAQTWFHHSELEGRGVEGVGGHISIVLSAHALGIGRRVERQIIRYRSP